MKGLATWWKEQFKDYVALGVEGYWNDMNEIATWGQMLPENIEMDFDGNIDFSKKMPKLDFVSTIKKAEHFLNTNSSKYTYCSKRFASL